MSFNLNGKIIYLYGYNDQFGRNDRIINNLKKLGYSVKAIIDREKKEAEYRIISFEDFIAKESIRDDNVFILNFMDANMHVVVADILHSNGFENIIFLPFDDKYDYEKAIELRRIYNDLLYGGVFEQSSSVPCYTDLLQKKQPEVIKRYEGFTEFWADIDSLYVVKISEERDVDPDYKLSVFSEKPVTEYTYYYELWNYLYEEGAFPTGYMVNSARGRDYSSFLNNRKHLFDSMIEKIKYDNMFFIESPVLVEVNEDNKITVLDGLHRILVLSKNGYQKIPVICSNEEYELLRK